MLPAADRRRMTVDEYLAFERTAPTKHQFVAGEVFAMAGASPRHNAIVAALIRHLGNALDRGPCRVFPSDLKIHISAFATFTYPDVTIVCGDLTTFPDSTDICTNPKVIIEVLSDSPESYDRGEKAEAYRTIPSVTDHLLVSQHKPHVEHYTRQPDGTWVLRETGAGGRIAIPSVKASCDVDAIYAGVFALSD